MARLVALILAVGIAGVARGELPNTDTSTAPPPSLEPPKLIFAPELAWPADATYPPGTIIEVVVRVRVDEHGEVDAVELVKSAGAPFDHAIVEAVAQFRFEPARYGGEAVRVDVNYTQRFVAPYDLFPEEEPGGMRPFFEEPGSPGGLRPNAQLAGKLIERGTRRPIANASVIATVYGDNYETMSDDEGNFALPLFAGTATVAVIAGAYKRFVQIEEIEPGSMLRVSYLLQRERYDPYEIIVTAKRDRIEVARTTLSGRELQQVAGTFGDPFRVIGALPGVSTMMSLIPFPIVRGSSPGNTGFLVDGVRVPLLFHLLAGPSVIHPELIESVDFAPGGFSAEYGGYIGGIVDGKTRRAAANEQRFDVDLNLLQLGMLYRRPIEFMQGTGTIAGRIGYPGLLVSLASPRVDLSYWDYQARFDGGSKNDGWTMFVFGANDSLDAIPNGAPDTEEKLPLLHLSFHRFDLQVRSQYSETVQGDHQFTAGYDETRTPDLNIGAYTVTPRVRWTLRSSKRLDVRFGVEGLFKKAEVDAGPNGPGELGMLLGGGEPSDTLLDGGAMIEFVFRPSEDWMLRPGIRADVYTDTNATHASVDPRFLARYRVSDDVWMKSSVGLYHQPPRFTIPLPGLDEIAFSKGLLEAVQVMGGADAALGGGWSADLQGFFNWMDPILYDTQINPDLEDIQNTVPDAPPGMPPIMSPSDSGSLNDRLSALLQPAIGRSYGVELLLRRESRSGISGWLSYTLSRSERMREGRWTGFDFDRTHILNLVLSIPLPRDWQLGLRAQIESGRPLTTPNGASGARTDPFVRFDLRIDKTAVWNEWMLDFYIDIANVVLGAEELTTEEEVRYVFPTVGFRGVF